MPQVVQARVLVCVGECAGHRALQLRVRRVALEQLAAPRLEVQLVVREVAAPHARRRGTRGLARRLGWRDVVLLDGDGVLGLVVHLVQVVHLLAAIHRIVKVAEGLETIEPDHN